jgi:hypothetical protein
MSIKSLTALPGAFEQTNNLICELVLRRRLSTEPQLVELEVQLLELRDTHRLYKDLLDRSPWVVALDLDAARRSRTCMKRSLKEGWSPNA